MTMASDKLASIREPTLTLDFDVDESGQDRHISVELTNEELKNLISSLEAANKVSYMYLLISMFFLQCNNRCRTLIPSQFLKRAKLIDLFLW